MSNCKYCNENRKCSACENLESTRKIIESNHPYFFKVPEQKDMMVTLNLDGEWVDKHSPLTIILNGDSITLDHEDIKELFHREKERKITKLIDFMRENDFKEKDISGVVSNLRSES